jgi:hypothetical protein
MRSARASRQAATATRRASTVWSAPMGASASIIAASRPANSAASSSGSMTYFRARMPGLSAFCAERAFPSAVFGPRDFAPFLRLASARALLTGTAAQRAAPALDMTVILGWRGLETGVAGDWRARTGGLEERQCNRC